MASWQYFSWLCWAQSLCRLLTWCCLWAHLGCLWSTWANHSFPQIFPVIGLLNWQQSWVDKTFFLCDKGSFNATLAAELVWLLAVSVACLILLLIGALSAIEVWVVTDVFCLMTLSQRCSKKMARSCVGTAWDKSSWASFSFSKAS